MDPLRVPGAADVAPLTLPARPVPAPRPGIPWLASAVPVVGALGFWAVTGSAFALWFALLGPLIAVAGVADGARTARRERKAAAGAAARTRDLVGERVAARHSVEREARRARHPDVAGFLARPDQIWRPVEARRGRVVVGRGEVASEVRVNAGDDPDDVAVAGAARILTDAPVLVGLGGGIAVIGPAPYARATVRALLLQLACSRPPGEVEIVGTAEDWVRTLPHARPGATRVVWIEDAPPPAAADVVVAALAAGRPVPAGCAAVVEIVAPGRARLDVDGTAQEIRVEAMSEAQAAVLAAELADRARAHEERSEQPLALSSVRPRGRVRSRAGLPVQWGTDASGPIAVDIVRDGPHAVVTGMTGSGKSELLVTWVTALCARYTTADVCFLLADFKGGTAFDALAGLPHVTGVITDLDEAGAARAIASLQAEMRTREERLARAGARDVEATDLPRLVVVVDEFAALRQAHPDLEALFADLAARGRALGIHLILGTQRAGGVLRDGLLANCPLRVSLRVADRADSSAVLGTPDAAALPGGAAGRGIAYVRRSGDDRPVRVRVALSDTEDLAAAAVDAGPAPHAPWLPALPILLPSAALTAGSGGWALGMVDDPAHQRQYPWRFDPPPRGLLVVGGAGSGKTSLLRRIGAQAVLRSWIGPDPEQAWDALCAAMLRTPPAGTVLIVDDLDALVERFPDEYAGAAIAAVERLVREAGGAGLSVVAAVQRLSGAVGRAADLFPERIVLGTASRTDHVAAGGDPSHYLPAAPPGRGHIGGREVQVAFDPDPPAPDPAPVTPLWVPPVGLSGFVTPRSAGAAVARWERTGVRVRAVDAADDPAVLEPVFLEPDGRVVLVGSTEQWLTRSRLRERVCAAHPLVVDAACLRDLRMLTGERDLPPYADPARGRAWLFTPGAAPERVAVTPAPEPHGSP